MDLNYVLMWLVGTSSGLAFVLIVMRQRLRQPGWLAVHGATFGLLFLFRAHRPEIAGYLAGAIWGVTAALPLVALGLAQRFANQQRFRWAHRFAVLAGILHPMDGWRGQGKVLAALAHAEQGNREAARAELTVLARGTSLGAWIAKLHLLHLDGAWYEVVREVEKQKGGAPLPREPMAAASYVRALGELNEIDSMMIAYRDVERTAGLTVDATLPLIVAALSGRPDAVERLYRGALDGRPREFKAFWLGSAHQRAGNIAEARRLLGPLSERGGPLVRERAKQRLEEAVVAKPVDPLLEPALGVLERRTAALEAMVPKGAPIATLSFVALSGLVFLRELPGGSTDPKNLYALGALFMGAASGSFELWRVATASVLHFGWLHLTMNVLALLLFGSQLEAIVGRLRMAGIYVFTGAGSLALAALATVLADRGPAFLVGASGSVMGVVGALTGIYARRWWKDRSRMALSVLWPMLLVIGLQVGFDLSTPQVSMSAHLFGVVLGAALGWLSAGSPGRKLPAPSRPTRRSWSIAVCAVAVGFGAFEWRAQTTAQANESIPAFLACYDGQMDACGRACEDGHVASCLQAAYAYSQGEGVPLDEARALSFYRRACDGGRTIACSNLGLMYRYGRGAAVDEERAVELFEHACRDDHPRGCALLADMLAEGAGVARDPVRAHALFEAACEDGDALACDSLQEPDPVEP